MGFGKSTGKVLALVAAMAAMGSGAQSFGSSNAAGKDIVSPKAQPTRSVPKKIAAGGDSPFKYYKKFYRNQRQYRKWAKQCPHLRRSKKCKL